MAEDDPWFVYQHSAGRITGRPANAKGWAALLGAVAAIHSVALPLMAGLIRAGHPIMAGLALTSVLLVGLYLIFRLMLAKGRRID